MTSVFIDKRGVVTQGPVSDPVEIYIEQYETTSSTVFLSPDDDGMIVTRSLAPFDPPFEFLAHSGSSQTASGGLNYSVLQINGLRDSYRGGFNGGIHCWNTSSNVFQPDSLTSSYTIRINGSATPTGGNPVLQIDFALSGALHSSVTNNVKGLRHHQSWEKTIRNGNHEHLMGTFQIFVDEDLYVSGGQFYIATDGSAVQVVSAAILITKR